MWSTKSSHEHRWVAALREVGITLAVRDATGCGQPAGRETTDVDPRRESRASNCSRRLRVNWAASRRMMATAPPHWQHATPTAKVVLLEERGELVARVG